MSTGALDVRITISGNPGSGKSTLAKNLVRALGYPYMNAGQIFRDAAAARGMTLAEFSAYADAHPDIDRKLEARLEHEARAREDIILEGRLAGWVTKRAGIPAFRVWVTAADTTRAERLVGREGGDLPAVTAAMHQRAEREREQYRRVYGIDLSDLTLYDVVIHTDDRMPKETLAVILQAIGYHGNAPKSPV